MPATSESSSTFKDVSIIMATSGVTTLNVRLHPSFPSLVLKFMLTLRAPLSIGNPRCICAPPPTALCHAPRAGLPERRPHGCATDDWEGPALQRGACVPDWPLRRLSSWMGWGELI